MTGTYPRGVAVLSALIMLVTVIPQAQALRTLSAGRRVPPATVLSMCDQAIQLPPSIPQMLPPLTSGPVVYLLGLCFEPQGSRSRVPPEQYLRDIHLKVSRPSQGLWIPYDALAEKDVFDDYGRLWSHNALANLSIEIRDYPFPNGVIGKLVTYTITEGN